MIMVSYVICYGHGIVCYMLTSWYCMLYVMVMVLYVICYDHGIVG